MYEQAKNKKGLTVIELVIAIAIASILVVISVNLLRLTTKTHSLSLKEYDMQSSIRRATEETNQIIRYSKAVFAVPQNFVESTDKMDPDWSYFMVSEDGKKIVSMEYDNIEKKFIEKILVPEQKNIRYEVLFEKNSGEESDSDENAIPETLMNYVINAYVVDENGNKVSEKMVFETTIKTVNAVQVIDKGTGIPTIENRSTFPSVALAYRKEGLSGKSKSEVLYITLVVDVSGSMNSTPNDGNPTSQNPSRINRVKEVLIGKERPIKIKGVVEQFKEENIYVSLVPFATTANYPDPEKTISSNENKAHPIDDVYFNRELIYDISNKTVNTRSYDDENVKNLGEKVEDLKAVGGTNTGDALRRAYHLHENFRNIMEGEELIDKKSKVHHYMILLIDGKSTYDVREGSWNKVGYGGKYFFKPIGANEPITNNSWWNFIQNKEIGYYLEDGNIKITKVGNSYTYTTGQSNNPNINYSIVGTGYESESSGWNLTTHNLDNIGTYHVDAVGEKIRAFEDRITGIEFEDIAIRKGIKTYIIGYASGLTESIMKIGDAIGTESEDRYNYSDAGDFDLREVFQNIIDDIMADYRMLTGPQLQAGPQIQN